MKYFFLFITISLLILSCEPEKSKEKQLTQQEMEQLLIDSHRAHVKKEDFIMDNFAKENGWENVQISKTGIRYWIYKNGDGKSFVEAKNETNNAITVAMAYQANLTTGEMCSGAAVDKPLFFVAGESDVISGIHELVNYLHEGDMVKVIFPAHLAYGLTGDKNIPPNSPLVYDLKILKWNY